MASRNDVSVPTTIPYAKCPSCDKWLQINYFDRFYLCRKCNLVFALNDLRFKARVRDDPDQTRLV